MTDWLEGSPDRAGYPGAEPAVHAGGAGQAWRQDAYQVAADPLRTPDDLLPPAAGPQAARPPGRNGGGGPGGRRGRRGAPGPASRGRRQAGKPGRRRKLARLALLLCGVLSLTSAGTYVWASSKLHRDVDLGKIEGRPAAGAGTNYLIVGSDSRAGLTGQDRKNLHTGGSADAGRRTDSMILLHTGAHGTTMMSLPRDSWVTIPAYIRPDTGRHYPASKNKLNAAFSFGGPDLLIRTIEHNTGLRINHYTEIGFAGFVGIVNAVGGVPMCLDKDVKDEKSGEDLKKGCHTLDGRTALAFVRQRHQEAQGDLGRSKNQQKFLAALAAKAGAPGTFLDPATLYPTVSAGLDTLIVDKGTGLPELTSLFEGMKKATSGSGRRLTVPVADLGFRTPKGSAVKWDLPKARKLFAELRADRPVDVTSGR
ncbi:LCP family protein [Streptomyces sp. NPDC001657]|uniref:LCP family protein n=1 Tax=Streptomyces sp. NPDC001657 TaxID=3154522 RepID=UPI003322558B